MWWKNAGINQLVNLIVEVFHTSELRSIQKESKWSMWSRSTSKCKEQQLTLYDHNAIEWDERIIVKRAEEWHIESTGMNIARANRAKTESIFLFCFETISKFYYFKCWLIRNELFNSCSERAIFCFTLSFRFLGFRYSRFSYVFQQFSTFCFVFFLFHLYSVLMNLLKRLLFLTSNGNTPTNVDLQYSLNSIIQYLRTKRKKKI